MSTLFAPLFAAALSLASHTEPPPPETPETQPAPATESAASPPAPIDPDEPPAPIAPSVPVVDTPPPGGASESRVIGVDTLTQCKTMLLEVNEAVDDTPEQRDARLDIVEKCFRSRAHEQTDPREMARALAMADVVAAWRVKAAAEAAAEAASAAAAAPAAAPAAGSAPAAAAKKPAVQPVSLIGLVESGHAEALMHGAAAGGTGGFLLAATLFSTTRQNEQDTLPWLIASPAVGAVAGAAGAWALVEVAEPTTGDIALASSAMWMGATQGFMLQLAVFDQNQEVSSIPLRFLTVFGGGAVGLASGVALSPFLDVTQGDAAVANSAALWGGVMATYGLAFMGSNGTSLTTPQVALLLSAGSTLPYLAVVAAHPYLSIERWPSWLIEAGGAGGFLVTAAAIGVLGSQTGINGPIVIAAMGAGTLSGVVAGTAAAYVVSTQSLLPAGEVRPQISFAPSVVPDGYGNVVPAFVAAGRF